MYYSDYYGGPPSSSWRPSNGQQKPRRWDRIEFEKDVRENYSQKDLYQETEKLSGMRLRLEISENVYDECMDIVKERMAELSAVKRMMDAPAAERPQLDA